MSLNLGPLDDCVDAAVRQFWASRVDAAQRQRESGTADQGERAGVTAGKNLDGFISLFAELAKANGLEDLDVFTSHSLVTLPGYFRATKNWDLVVLSHGRLVAAIELKSQVGPSFGNNFNNRAEEAIGAAHDFWTAFREGAFGSVQRPFLGWLILVEDCQESRRPGHRLVTPHFDVFPEFRNASYLDRYDVLCHKLMLENLYTHAALVTSRRPGDHTGGDDEQIGQSRLRRFAAAFAAHIAAVAAVG